MEEKVLVLLLATSQEVQIPILETIAVEHLSKSYRPDELSCTLQHCSENASVNVIESLVNFINTEKQQELSYVKTPTVHTVIPAG